MINNKQSSVDWLIVEIMQHQKTFYGVASIPFWLVEKAKAMHEEEIMEAHYAPKYGCFSEQYYNETFGGNDEQQ